MPASTEQTECQPQPISIWYVCYGWTLNKIANGEVDSEIQNLAYNLHMNDTYCGPLVMVIWVATSMFSPPQSPWTYEGKPYSVEAVLKRSSTVADRLLLLAHKAVTCKQVSVWIHNVDVPHHLAKTINYSMNNNTPSDQFVMSIKMPKRIRLLDMILAAMFHLPITEDLSNTINPAQWFCNTAVLYTYSLLS